MHPPIRIPRSALALAALAAPLATGAAAQTTLFRLPGGTTGERQGSAARLVADVDGDGVPDLLVGAPGAAGALGRARVVSGDKGTLVHELFGTTPGGELGAALAAADLNLDGRADPLLGAPLAGSGARGVVTAVDGLSGLPMFAVAGTSPGDHLGFSIAALDDVSGDSLPDFALGAIDDDDQGPSSGSVRVCSGYDGSPLYTLTGAAASELFGYALCTLPDLDGDGAGELAIAAPSAVSVGSTSPGYVVVVSGAGGTTLWSVAGKAGADAFGRALARVDDLDGDGEDDLAVGAPQPTGGKPGYVQVLSSATGAVLLEVGGAAAGDLFGSALADAGDVDGDGKGDLAVGAPRADGPAGSNSGAVRLFSGSTGATLGGLYGAQAGARLGAALDGGPDTNGDGIADLVAGAPDAAGGEARTISTRDLALSSDAHLLSLASGAAQVLALDGGPGHAGEAFVVLGSLSGTKPGVAFNGMQVALKADRYFDLTLKRQATGPLAPGTGVLDASGSATVTFSVPAQAPAALLVGLTFRHAFVTIDPSGTATLASNTVPMTLLP